MKHLSPIARAAVAQAVMQLVNNDELEAAAEILIELMPLHNHQPPAVIPPALPAADSEPAPTQYEPHAVHHQTRVRRQERSEETVGRRYWKDLLENSVFPSFRQDGITEFTAPQVTRFIAQNHPHSVTSDSLVAMVNSKYCKADRLLYSALHRYVARQQHIAFHPTKASTFVFLETYEKALQC